MAKYEWSKYDTGITLALLCGTLGAASWIEGLAIGLITGAGNAGALPAGILWDFLVVQSCVLAVVLAGLFLRRSYLSGRRLSAVFVSETLLGASLVFGTIAIVWTHVRGVLGLAVVGSADTGQPGDELWIALARHVPPAFAYSAPLLLLTLMALAWWPSSRKRLLGAGADAHIQRGTPEGECPWHLPPLPSLFQNSPAHVDQLSPRASPAASGEPSR